MYLRASGRCCGRKVTENSVVAGKAGAARRWSGVARCDLARMVGRAEPRRRTKAWLSVGGRRGLCGGQSVARTWPEGKRRSGAAAGGRVHPRTRTGGRGPPETSSAERDAGYGGRGRSEAARQRSGVPPAAATRTASAGMRGMTGQHSRTGRPSEARSARRKPFRWRQRKVTAKSRTFGHLQDGRGEVTRTLDPLLPKQMR